jgi:hypothetical protein
MVADIRFSIDLVNERSNPTSIAAAPFLALTTSSKSEWVAS